MAHIQMTDRHPSDLEFMEELTDKELSSINGASIPNPWGPNNLHNHIWSQVWGPNKLRNDIWNKAWGPDNLHNHIWSQVWGPKK